MSSLKKLVWATWLIIAAMWVAYTICILVRFMHPDLDPGPGIIWTWIFITVMFAVTYTDAEVQLGGK